MSDEDFEPWLGRMRDGGSKTSKRYKHQVIAAINRAGGRTQRKGFSGKRIGRGGAVGAILANRDQFASYRQRRVIVKARIVRFAGKGLSGAQAHMRYLQREGAAREGERGQLYDADHDQVKGKDFLERSGKDRHQFRFIVAPEDSLDYDDLKPLTRRLMEQMEQDLNTRLEWVAVDHYNTGHPHTHILVRGRDDQDRDLVIAPSYISTGIRERAAELVRIDLGPRTDYEIEHQLRTEMTAESFTSLDRRLLRMESDGGVSSPFDENQLRQTLLAGRLKFLERLSLAEERRPGQWHLDVDLENTLRRMGERGDIIKTMHREMTERNIVRSPGDYEIYNPASSGAIPVVGRVVAKILSDELNDRYCLIVDTTDGKALYIDIGRSDTAGSAPEGSIVRIAPKSLTPRQADLTIVDVAAANGGRYNIDLHLKHEARATFTYAEAHMRRLEAIRRVTNALDREPDGTWLIKPDHLDRVVQYEKTLAKRAPVIVEKLSTLTLEQQIGTNGATWLDRELVSGMSEPPRDSGFGRELKDALNRRRQWLIEQGLAQEEQGHTNYRSNMLAVLQKRELTRAAGKLSEELGLAYAESRPGSRIEGTLTKSVELASGKFAIVERSREFTLVPWRDVLDKHIGKQISGIMRENGVSWTIGRERGMGIS